MVALGGNALVGSGEAGTYREQCARARAMAEPVAGLVSSGWQVVLVHGNGPQVGALALQQESARAVVPGQPLFSLVAMTQGATGSLLTLALRERLGPQPPVVSMVTHTIVHGDDPAFTTPTKPIGPFLDEAEARQLALERGWTVVDDSGRGWRRVVPSPEPLGLLELATVRALVEIGAVVIASGGGGIPVVMTGRGYRGIEAVVDKDLAAGRLASDLGVDALAIVTEVPAAAVDFGTPDERPLGDVPVGEAERHLAAGQFAAGSMGPKVEAAARFVRQGGSMAVITSVDRLLATLSPGVGRAPTRHPDPAGGPAGPRRMSSEVATVLRRLADTYVDSVLLLAATRAMQDVEGVTWATAVMATPANLEVLEDQGVAGPELDGAAANDLVLAVRAGDAAAADRALDGGARRCGASGLAQEHPGRHQQRGTWPWRLASCRGPTSPSSRCPAPMPPSRRTRRSRPGWTCCCSATTFPSMRRSS